MDVKFFAYDPREKARPRLDDILNHGVDQLAVACAFCTAAGAELLRSHSARFRRPDSFVVVSSAPPTDFAALAKLNQAIPGRLFVHHGAIKPYESKVGAALMHSKVFYARAGKECWLWTGSHNLTASATQGANCEAAVLLHGEAYEEPFVDALQHLTSCRDEAQPFQIDESPLYAWDKLDAIAIHAEAQAMPSGAWPWHVHLSLSTDQYDWLLTPPAQVRLFLYRPGSIAHGWRAVKPVGAYKGALSSLNFTDQHPVTRGIPASFSAANYGITESSGVLRFDRATAPAKNVTTQAVINIEGVSSINEALLSAAPKIETEGVPGEKLLRPVDDDMAQFFRRDSRQGASLVHQLLRGVRRVLRLPADEVRDGDVLRLRERFQSDISKGIDIRYENNQEPRQRHPYIVRAKYRITYDD